MSLPSGARFAHGEYERVQKALDELAKDAHAPREISVKVFLHVHNEYPKLLYKGAGIKDNVSVADAEAEASAREKGYGKHVPEVVEEA